MSELSEKILALINHQEISYGELSSSTGISKSALQRYATGETEKIPLQRLEIIAKALGTTAAALTGWIPPEAIPFAPAGRVPVLGTIPAGLPMYASEYIEDFEPVDFADTDNYFYLRVKGESMINAGISDGDLVLIRMQSTADNGQIVACLVNGDESTLKRFKRQGNIVLLLPENPAYEPIIVPVSDFESGNARIIGIVIELKRKYV